MKFTIVALATILTPALPAASHEVEKGPNGGRVVEAGARHVELVVKENAVNVFVTDASDESVSINGFKGVAIFTISGKAQRITLAPKEGTHLSGTSPVALPWSPPVLCRLSLLTEKPRRAVSTDLQPYRLLWVMYGRRPRCKGKESGVCAKRSGAAMYSASPCPPPCSPSPTR